MRCTRRATLCDRPSTCIFTAMFAADFPTFRPHRWAQSGHAQTVVATYHRTKRFPYGATPHEIHLPDGDLVMLHEDCPEDWRNGARVVLLVHGLAGCHGSPYLVRTAAKLNRHGVRTFRMDMRGMGAAHNKARHLAHAGRSEDVLAALRRASELAPDSPISLIGFSMGGNQVLKMLGESSKLPDRLDSALAVAPPIDLAFCCRELDKGVGRIYSRIFTRMLVRLVKQRPDIIEQVPDVMTTPPRGLWEFDERITSRLSGFDGAGDYYSQSSAARVLSSIQLPTLIVAAEDDPVVPAEMFEQQSWNDASSLYIVPGGGHVGFYGVSGVDPDRWWLDWRIVEWVLNR